MVRNVSLQGCGGQVLVPLNLFQYLKWSRGICRRPPSEFVWQLLQQYFCLGLKPLRTQRIAVASCVQYSLPRLVWPQMSSRYLEFSVKLLCLIDQVYSMALLCMGVAWPPYTRASQGGVLDIHLLWLPDHLSYIPMTTSPINGWYSQSQCDHMNSVLILAQENIVCEPQGNLSWQRSAGVHSLEEPVS